MIDIKQVVANTDIDNVVQLADSIWREHYIPIVGKPQIDYMLENFQSASAISEQIENGYEYYLMLYNEKEVGYLAILQEKLALFLSKIYVLKSFRGLKIGKQAMAFIETKARTYQKSEIRLTVNIHNINSIEAYTKLGFRNAGPQVTDIGSGFIMDDYLLVKTV